MNWDSQLSGATKNPQRGNIRTFPSFKSFFFYMIFSKIPYSEAERSRMNYSERKICERSLTALVERGIPSVEKLGPLRDSCLHNNRPQEHLVNLSMLKRLSSEHFG